MSRRTHFLTLANTGGGGGAGTPMGGGTYTFGSTSGFLASLIFGLDGQLVSTADGVATNEVAWLSNRPNATDAALYEIRRTQVSGVLGVTFTGTMTSGTWYLLSSDRGVTVIPGGVSRNNQSTFEIRLFGGPGTILATYNTNITADP